MNIVLVEQVVVAPRGDSAPAVIVSPGGQGPKGPPVSKVALEPAFSATPAINWDQCDLWKTTLTANITGMTFAGGYDGQNTTLLLKQGGAGGFTVAQPSNVRCPADILWPALTVTPGKLDRLGFMYDASAAKWDLVAVARGY